MTIDAEMRINLCDKCGSEMRYNRRMNANGELCMILQCKVCRFYYEVDVNEK